MASKKSLNLKRFAIVATYISAGVKSDGGGIAIINGKIIRIPPRGPVNQQVQAALRTVAALGKNAGR
jgi:hypothetical protein